MESENFIASIFVLPNCIVKAKLACSECRQKWCYTCLVGVFLYVWLFWFCLPF